MTLSDAHEDIVDDFAYAMAIYNADHDFDDFIPVAIEHIVAALICPGLKNLGLWADAYIFPRDGYAVMPIEIGRMKDGKWDDVYDVLDGNPVRILRIDFQKNIHLIRPRHTDWERMFVNHLVNNGFQG